jgi:hypothetical protein
VLLLITWWILQIAPVPTATKTTALSSPSRAPAGVGPAVPGGARRIKHGSPPKAPPRLTDGPSGLSYRLLSAPWRRGCPQVLQTPMFSWSAGENAVAGHVLLGGSSIEWHANACSGQLQQQFAYAGPADLATTAMSLTDALDPAYYAGIQHNLQVQDSSPTLVSGHQAWEVRFQVIYAADPGQGVTWTSELGAVVVIDRGTDRVPSVFYVSVPDDVGTSAVGTLLGSLRAGR